ncbi:hypothetical protein ATANTOWER_030398 [Ataeniobius toweri]|uniref:Uncharacterized protein n=1 Tax=Ataeniobius toweri TaxID=208326 RepID=A0ABU7AIF4_9TELE|nr:hypothetical protein [Ataeniobius toweri]
MPPVFGHATAVARLLCKFLCTVTAIFVVTSARFSPGYVSALLFYDRSSLFGIKESMESLFSDWGKYNQTFPPPFVVSPNSPEYLLLFRAPGRKRRKRGSRSGVQVKCRHAL